MLLLLPPAPADKGGGRKGHVTACQGNGGQDAIADIPPPTLQLEDAAYIPPKEALHLVEAAGILLGTTGLE
jgi:hypothetical protein